jgi:hypothetical protein
MLRRLVEHFDPDEFRVRQDEPNAWPFQGGSLFLCVDPGFVLDHVLRRASS